MKKQTFIFVLSLFLLNFNFSGSVSGVNPAELSTGIIPSALPEKNVSERWLSDFQIDGQRQKAFYVKRDPEEVKAYYEDLHSSASRDGDNIWKIEVMSRRDVTEFTSGRDVSAEAANVRVYSAAPRENPFVARAFVELENSYLSRFSNLSTREKSRRKNDEELQSVLRQYEFLKRAFFPRTSQKRTLNDGTEVFKGLEEVLFERFFADSDQIRAMRLQEYLDQYANLIVEGKLEEAASVSERIDALSKTASNSTDMWNHAINYLEELRKLAYRTLLVIDRHPSEW
ncbi:MAG: hypothetical protein EA412_06980 [Chitinophagaceae bacterium]|nr:MAG: hypothetical protein EA412_06980 [Chitinophagaceae bacterium]